MMAKKPADRFQTPAEVATALQPFTVTHSSATPVYRSPLPESLQSDRFTASTTEWTAEPRPGQARISNRLSTSHPDVAVIEPQNGTFVTSASVADEASAGHAANSESADKSPRRWGIISGTLGAMAALGIVFGLANGYLTKTEIVSHTVVKSADNSPVPAHLTAPSQSMVEHLDRLKNTLMDIKNGRANKLDPIKEYNREQSEIIWLESGTPVEVLISSDEQAASPQLSTEGGFASQMSSLAEAANIKVRVMAGPANGKEVWVPRGQLCRENFVSQSKPSRP